MNIKILHDKVRLILNNTQSQYWSPEDIDSMINLAQTDKYRDVYAAYEQTQQVTDAIRPFKKVADHTRTVDGVFLLPADYYHLSNISSLVAVPLEEPPLDPPLPDIEHSGKIYTDGEWLDAMESELLPPTATDIKARVINGAIEVLPPTQSKIRIYFITQPKDVVFAYDLVNDKITYKDQGSVDLEWADSEVNDIIMRTVKYLGIPMKSQIDMQAEQLTQQQASS